jgi:RNA polymerase nonessential primary-like sigma factor
MTEAERNSMVEGHTPLALSVARRLWRVPFVRRLGSFADCCQEAKLALLHAARSYDPSRGVRFSTFATKVIFNHLTVAAAKGDLVKVPKYFLTRKRRETSRYREQAARAQRAGQLPGGWSRAAEQDHASPDPDCVRAALSRLSARDREVIARRFGLAGHPRQVLREVGAVLGVTRSRVQQIEARALERLRGILEG